MSFFGWVLTTGGSILLILISSAVSLLLLLIGSKRILDWNDAAQMSRVMTGVLWNYARHGVSNSGRLITLRLDEEKRYQVALRKQIYITHMLDEQLGTLYKLFHPDVIAKVLHVQLLVRNFNLEVESFLTEEKWSQAEIENALFTRNIRLALASDKMAKAFEVLAGKYSLRPQARYSAPRFEQRWVRRLWFWTKYTFSWLGASLANLIYTMINGSTKYMDDDVVTPSFSEFDAITFDMVHGITVDYTDASSSLSALVKREEARISQLLEQARNA